MRAADVPISYSGGVDLLNHHSIVQARAVQIRCASSGYQKECGVDAEIDCYQHDRYSRQTDGIQDRNFRQAIQALGINKINIRIIEQLMQMKSILWSAYLTKILKKRFACYTALQSSKKGV